MQVQAAEIVQGRQPGASDRALGERVAAYRKARGMSQSTLGEGIGVTFQQVQKYESGRNRIGAGRLLTIARLLDVPATELLGMDEDTVGEHGAVGFVPLLAVDGAGELLRVYASIGTAAARRDFLSSAQIFAKHTRKVQA